MKSAVVLACFLAVAAAQLDSGRYFPNNYNNQYNRYNQNNQYNQYNRYNTPTPNHPYRPYVSSTARPSVFVTSTYAPIVPPVVPVLPVAPVPVVPVTRVASSDRSAETLRYGNEVNPDGSFNYYYETNNGIAAQEQGVPRNFGGEPAVAPSVAQGSFSWTSPEGKVINIQYVADENGYQPSGDAIPQPPAVPAQIARALEYAARYTAKNA